jgi:hypothetical protein
VKYEPNTKTPARNCDNALEWRHNPPAREDRSTYLFIGRRRTARQCLPAEEPFEFWRLLQQLRAALFQNMHFGPGVN